MDGDEPHGKRVKCPFCSAVAYSIVPKGRKITQSEKKADGKVWTTCLDCGERFLVYYK